MELKQGVGDGFSCQQSRRSATVTANATVPVKGELGWADFQVRSDRAIRRHWTLVCCAFSFCWQAFLAKHPDRPAPADPQAVPTAARGAQATGHRGGTGRRSVVAEGVASGAGVATSLERAGALLAVVVASAPATAAPSAA